ncbi:uncharacterized protein LOC110699850 [Chenopodium quinoa]|uniref:uncharacterized protein LOC110699850 n=1 Tax=Chenopodium quinoa TaxID=63459 RepID=UPI000B77E0F6|nr:uncharacterized protein LOC110699850 [Chenopodium quinoa]
MPYYSKGTGRPSIRMISLPKSLPSFLKTQIPPELNKTTITLILKVSSPQTIKQFRPISLCTTTYKVVTKILVNKLRPLLNSMISPNENSFLPGRGVNYIVASEILHSMRIKKEAKGFFATKIDLEKAYDSLEWDFILKALCHHGFDEDTRKLIMSCVSFTSSSVMFNGPTSFFNASRGIRQGDPISPYLSILCMELFSEMIVDACSSGSWDPIFIPRSSLTISHLLSADDIMLFRVATPQNAAHIMQILDDHSLSGLKMNPAKSKLYFSKNTKHDIISQISSTFGVQQTPDLGTYLGFPLCDRRPSKAALSYIIQKKPILKALDSCLRNFFWGSNLNSKKLPMVAWQKICAPKDLRGLGIRSTAIVNSVSYAGKYIHMIILLPKSSFTDMWPIEKPPKSSIKDLISGILRHLVQGPLSPSEERLCVGQVASQGKWDFSVISFQLPQSIVTIIYSVKIFHSSQDQLICANRGWEDVTIITDSRTVVNGIGDKQKIRDKYFNLSTVCKEYISEGKVKSIQCLPREAVR